MVAGEVSGHFHSAAGVPLSKVLYVQTYMSRVTSPLWESKRRRTLKMQM